MHDAGDYIMHGQQGIRTDDCDRSGYKKTASENVYEEACTVTEGNNSRSYTSRKLSVLNILLFKRERAIAPRLSLFMIFEATCFHHLLPIHEI